ncbi:MAG: NAD-dependent epimerase/dehydratase family protein [Chloroflexi bacterium]|jgi:NADH dehydrogenase|nr:NAD-dependent epimerase/dehydratase family protein [Chloroflexota bacterium]
MAGENILVTGATGFIGSSLMRLLARQGYQARAYSGRMNDPLRLRQELEGIEIVYHLASAERRGRRRLLQHVDVEGAERLVEESRRARVGQLIVVSRLNTDPNSHYPLLRAKGEMERLIWRSELSYTIVRSATVFGLHDRFLNVIAGLSAWTWPFVVLPGGGKTPFQPLWVEDLARCLVQILDRPDLRGEIVEIAGEERIRFADLAQLIMRTVGMQRIPVPVDLRLLRPTNRLLMSWWPYPPVTPFFMDLFSQSDIAPVDSVLRTFGFRPNRLIDNLGYLRRPGLRRYLFRR